MIFPRYARVLGAALTLLALGNAAPLDCPAQVNVNVHRCMAPVKRYAEVRDRLP